MKNWTVVFWYVDTFDARFDELREETYSAWTKESALDQFREDFGDGHGVQCVFEKREAA